MEKKKIVIVGISKSAKQVYDFIKTHNLVDISGFAVDSKYIKEKTYLNFPVYPLENLKDCIDIDEVELFVAIGWNRLNADRRDMYNRLKKEGYKFANLISPTAIVRGRLDGDNIWINDYSVLQSDCVIKSNVVIREQVLIGNNTVIEPHCFIGVKSLVAGGCKIGEQTFCGLSSTIFDATNIGKKCLVGACTSVKRHMPDYSLCKTAIESTVTKQYTEDVIETKLVTGRSVR